MADTWFTVFVAAAGPPLPENAAPREGEASVLTWPLDNLAQPAADLDGVEGAVAGWGGPEGGPNLQLSVRAEDAATAASRAAEAFAGATHRGGVEAHPVVRIEVMTEELRDGWLKEPPPPSVED